MKGIRKIVPILILAIGSCCSALYFSCKKDACNTVTCLNGGSCAGGLCSCPVGWTGTFCETSAFGGSWNGADICDSQSYNFAISVSPSSSDTVTFYIQNPHGFAGSQLMGTRSGAKTINIPNQPCDTVMFSGTLTLTSNNALTFSYTITDTGKHATITQCSGNYNSR